PRSRDRLRRDRDPRAARACARPPARRGELVVPRAGATRAVRAVSSRHVPPACRNRRRRGEEGHPGDAPRRARLPGGRDDRRALPLAALATLKDLRAWIALLEREGELVRVTAEVDPDLEITEIVDRVVKAGG